MWRGWIAFERLRQACAPIGVPLAIRCVRVVLFNLSTQFRPTQTINKGFLSSPTPRADRTRADGSEQISPPPITHHTVYEKTRYLHSAKTCLSMGNTIVPGGSAISSRGQTSF